MYIIMQLVNKILKSPEILEINRFLLVSSNVYHKKMLLESLTIPLTVLLWQVSNSSPTNKYVYMLIFFFPM